MRTGCALSDLLSWVLNPVERLQQALNTVIYSITSIRLKVDGWYAVLCLLPCTDNLLNVLLKLSVQGRSRPTKVCGCKTTICTAQKKGAVIVVCSAPCQLFLIVVAQALKTYM
jgi:hypothetical protein